MFMRHLVKALSQYQYWMLVSLLNTVGKYRESFLGPLWISLSIGIFIFALGNLYGLIWEVEPTYFVPYLAAGYIIWHMMSATITQGVKLFNSNKNYILQSKMVLPVYNLKMLFEIGITLVHNLLVLLFVFVWYWRFPGIVDFLMFLVGFSVLVINMIWVSTLLGILGAAYKDLIEFINVLLRIAFLATPVIWMAGDTAKAAALDVYLMINPFYHFLEITRAPLLGEAPDARSWGVVAAITLIGYGFTYFVYERTYKKIAIWI